MLCKHIRNDSDEPWQGSALASVVVSSRSAIHFRLHNNLKDLQKWSSRMLISQLYVQGPICSLDITKCIEKYGVYQPSPPTILKYSSVQQRNFQGCLELQVHLLHSIWASQTKKRPQWLFILKPYTCPVTMHRWLSGNSGRTTSIPFDTVDAMKEIIKFLS